MLSTVVPVHHVLLLVWNTISTHKLSIDSHYNQLVTSASRLTRRDDSDSNLIAAILEIIACISLLSQHRAYSLW